MQIKLVVVFVIVVGYNVFLSLTTQFNYFNYFIYFYHKIQLRIEQESYTKANESGEEAQKRNPAWGS